MLEVAGKGNSRPAGQVARYHARMGNENDSHLRGVPAWVGPLLIGLACTFVASAAGAAVGMGAKVDALNVRLATLQTAFDALCKQLENQPAVDRAQDERLRQLELEMRSLRHR